MVSDLALSLSRLEVPDIKTIRAALELRDELVGCFQKTRWIARDDGSVGDLAFDDGACAHHTARADGRSGQDDAVHPNQRIIANPNASEHLKIGRTPAEKPSSSFVSYELDAG